MHPGSTTTLRREFRGPANLAAYQRFQQQQRQERERRNRNDEVEKDASNFLDVAVSLITASETSAFRMELDSYDAATIAALQENETELALSREKLDALLAKAHMLPDGRRVFKTEDGLRVFDENGNELDASTIDPNEIADTRPRWEVYRPEFVHFNDLTQERRDLIGYQARLDEARERLDAGDISRDEFDNLREDLKAEMPEAVRAQIPELAAEQEARAQTSIAKTDTEFEISDDMVPGSSAPTANDPVFGR